MTLMALPPEAPVEGEIVIPDRVGETLATALRSAQQDIAGGVHKGSTNSFHKYEYASAEDMMKAARAVLLAHGLVASRGSWSLGELCGNIVAKMTMNLRHAPTGEMIDYQTEYPVIPDKGRPLDKALNAALTTSMAYWLRDLLLIPRVDEEVDTRDDRDSRPTKGSSLKDKLKGTQAEGLINAAKSKLGATVAEDDNAWLKKFDAACAARSIEQGAADVIYNRVIASAKFKEAYDKSPSDAWKRLIAKVEAGEFDQNKAA